MQRDKMILFFAGTWQPTVESAMLSTKQPAAPAFFILSAQDFGTETVSYNGFI